MQQHQNLISPPQLATLLDDIHPPVVFDCSWHMPGSDRNAAAEFAAAHIPGARFFDFDQRICDAASPLPHMLPEPQVFTREVRLLGVQKSSLVVCYDSLGIFTAPRVWWMFRAMGHNKVCVLDGGLPAWQQAGRSLETGDPVATAAGNFIAELQPQLVADSNLVLAALDDQKGHVLLDARSSERFSGRGKEPRPGIRSGHMPGAKNLHYQDLLEDGRYKSTAELTAIFAARIDAGQRVITSCGSGVTASILALGAVLAGYDLPAVYDGSWSEWGQIDSGLPVVRE